MKSRELLAPALAAVMALACATGDAQWTGTITDSAGVTIVSNTAQGIWPEGEGWTLEEELKLGSIDEDPEYQFGQVGRIEVTSDGRLYVMDAQAQHVKVFSNDGEYLQTFGGPGSGPGELGGGGANFMAMGAGDTLLIRDIGNLRINRYAPDGTTLESIPLRIEEGIPGNWRSTGTGLIAWHLRPFDLPNRPATDSMDVIVMVGTDGGVRDTLRRFRVRQTFTSGGRRKIPIYSPEPVWHLTPDEHLLFGVNTEYRIGVYGEGGALQRVIAMPFELEPVSDRDKSAVIGFMERLWRGVPPNIAEQLKESIHFGEYFPAFASIIPGPDGSVWVQRVQAASELSAEELESYNGLFEVTHAPRWDVFDAEGRFLGNVTMPTRFTLYLIRDDRIYGMWRDELDVQYVVRLKVVGQILE